MQRAIVLMVMFSSAAFALEDGVKECTDELDNDGDGRIDSAETECMSSVNAFGLLPGPIAVGIGGDRRYVEFDVPMSTINGVVGSTMMVADLGADGASDVVLGRASSVTVFENNELEFYVGLPRTGLVRTGFLSGTVRYAAGDFNGDGRADLVAVNGTSMRRYLGNASGNGTFTGQTPVTATPGPAGGLPAIVATTVGIANTRLRLYDSSCNAAPVGFPSNETFVAGALCASVDLPGTSAASHIVPATAGNGAKFFLTVTGSTVALYRVTVSTGAVKVVNAVLQDSITISGVRDVAWSPADLLFVFATGNNTVVARSIAQASSGVTYLVNVGALGTLTVDTGQITQITVGEFVAGERSIVFSDAKTETVSVVPFTLTGGWRPRNLVVASYDVAPLTEQHAVDLAVGNFNDDDLLDVAVLDAKTGNVIIVRQQPAPCMSFITSPSQGMIIFPSGSYEPIAAFNRRLATEVTIANAARRPASGFRDLGGPAALCPVRFIDVRGHWEKLSGEGDILVGISRGAWVSSDWFIWVPKPLGPLGIPNPLTSPGIVPAWYWASALLYLPAVAIGDYNAVGRLALGGVGFGTEVIGRSFTSSAGIAAPRLLNATLLTAISDADSRMDECTGTIFVDLLGHSRGGPMITQTLRQGFGARGNYNFEVSTTILDAPDPSGNDNWRPWVKGGFIVGDPVITRVGSEWNSSFYSKDTGG